MHWENPLTPLHLQHVSVNITKIIFDAWLEAVSERNKLNKNPLDYWHENEGDEAVRDIIGSK
eukprot:3091375-Ditylum_brightwellii.AAC.1